MRVLGEGADLQGDPNAAPVGALQEEGVETVQDRVHQQRLGVWWHLIMCTAPCAMGGGHSVGPGRAHSAQPELCRAACGILCVSAGSAPAPSPGLWAEAVAVRAGQAETSGPSSMAGPCGEQQTWWACGQAAKLCAGACWSMHCSTDGRQWALTCQPQSRLTRLWYSSAQAQEAWESLRLPGMAHKLWAPITAALAWASAYWSL